MTTYDIEYINTGLFTRFIPNTPAGEEAWKEMYNSYGTSVLTIHADVVRAQLRKAGYTVGKAPKPTHTIDEILAELDMENEQTRCI